MSDPPVIPGRLPIARPVCTCGHLKANHHPDGRGKCSVWAHMRDSGPCGCRKYEEDTSAPAAHPA